MSDKNLTTILTQEKVDLLIKTDLGLEKAYDGESGLYVKLGYSKYKAEGDYGYELRFGRCDEVSLNEARQIYLNHLVSKKIDIEKKIRYMEMAIRVGEIEVAHDN